MDKSTGGPGLARIREDHANDNLNTVPPSSATAASPRVLVAHGGSDLYRQIANCLAECGCVPQAFNSPDTLLQQICRERPDMIVLDMSIPGVDGFDLLERVRAANGHRLVPVLALSDINTADGAQRAFDAGASDFVTKPIDPTLLRQRLRHGLESVRIAHSAAREIEHLRRAKKLARMVYWEYDYQTEQLHWCQGLPGLLGLPSNTRPTLDAFLERVVPMDAARVGGVFNPGKHPGNLARTLEFRVRSRGQDERTLRLCAEPATTDNAENSGLFGIFLDVANPASSGQCTSGSDRCDPVTGLPDQAVLEERLRQAILVTNAAGGSAALMALALDYEAGLNSDLEACTRVVAEAVVRAAGPTATVSRLGPQRFLILFPGAGDPGHVRQLAQQLLTAFQAPLELADTHLAVTPYIGIRMHEAGQSSQPGPMITEAGIAARDARGVGCRSYRLFEHDGLDQTHGRFELEAELRRAVEEETLGLGFQPQVALSERAFTRAAAVLDWTHDGVGRISPDQFMPVLESGGMAQAADLWLLRAASERISSLQAQSGQCPPISIKFSSRQPLASDLAERVRGVLEATNLSAEQLILELAETCLTQELAQGIRVLEQLKDLGVGVAIYDFGTGHTPLTYLRQLPIDVLKIDGGFVRGMTRDPINTAIVRSAVDLARGLGLETVAEQVDSEEELDMLRNLGCDLAQGGHTGPVMDADTLSGWVADLARAPCG